jgi:hypothetical protein
LSLELLLLTQLQIVEARIWAIELHQRLVRTTLNDTSMLQNQDLIGMLDSA